MRPEPTDSTKELLSPPQIMLQFAHQYPGNYPVPAVLAALAEELNMDDAESIQFGNTVFITHHSAEEKGTVFMRAMNVDTAENFVDNTENYVVYAYGKGIKTIVTAYDDSAISSVIKTVKRRVDKNNPNLDAKLTFERNEGQIMATIVLMKEDKK
jgi:hypothetical protein